MTVVIAIQQPVPPETILGIDADIFAAWAQAAGAIGAFAAAFVAVWVAIRDTRRRDRERDAERAAQALTVTANVDVRAISVQDTPPQPRTFVVVANHGNQPITDVRIEDVWLTATIAGSWEMGGLTKDGAVLLAAVIGPGASQSRRMKFTDIDKDVTVFADACRVTFAFLDG